MADMAKSSTCLPNYLEFITAELGASNHDTSSMPTVHCALFKMAAAGITKRLKGSSLKIDKKISSLGKAFFLI